MLRHWEKEEEKAPPEKKDGSVVDLQLTNVQM
jgi:hypothetical protein